MDDNGLPWHCTSLWRWRKYAEAFSGKESGWRKAFLFGVGILLIGIGITVLVSPVFGAQFAGFVVAIGLLIAGIQMIVAGFTGRELHLPTESLHK